MARPPDRGPHPNRQVTDKGRQDVVQGMQRAQAAWNETSPEHRAKAQVMKEALLNRLPRIYLDLEHEDPKGNVRGVTVPEGVDPGAYLTDWAAKNPPQKIQPKTEKSKVPHSLRQTNG